MLVRGLSFDGKQARRATSKERARGCVFHVRAIAFIRAQQLVVMRAAGRFLHMPFCDSIVGLARDNTAHLFNEKNLGCAWLRVPTAAAISAQTISADTCVSFLFGQTKRNRDT